MSFIITSTVKVTLRKKDDERLEITAILDSDYKEKTITTGQARKEFEKTSAEDVNWYNSQIRHTKDNGFSEISDSNHPWRLSAGGLLVYDGVNKKVVAIYRDDKAPSYPLHHTLASGISISNEEILNPSIISYREGAEELMYLSKNGTMLVPYVKGNELFNKLSEQEAIRQNNSFLNKEYSLTNLESVIADKAPHRLIIVGPNGKETVSEGVVVLDPATRGIDLIKLMVVYPEVEYTSHDGEKPFGIDRKVELLTQSEAINMKLTPPLYHALKEFEPVLNEYNR